MNELQQLHDEITQLQTALTIKNGTIAQLKARNAQLEDRNAALAVQVEARQVPEGWKVDRRELDGAICFIIGTPRKNGVRTNTSVWESDSDPAHLLLWHLLAASTGQEAAGHE